MEMTAAGQPRQRVVVLGGGTAGWMAAAVVNRFTPAQVTLVEADAIGTVGVGEATIPQLRRLNALLGIDEDRFLQACDGSIKLGIEFVGWDQPEARYLHAFGPIGRALGVVPFHHYWLRHAQAGGTADLWDFSANTQAARANRFARPRGDELDWAFHFDASRYGRFLRELAEARGVGRVEGEVVAVARDPAHGDVTALRLADGREVAGDLFLDCSGFRSRLLGEALAVPFVGWDQWLPCDRALAVPCAPTAPLTPYTRATAGEAGWRWRIPLRSRTGNGHVYASAWLADERAADQLLAGLDGPALASPRALRFRAGRRHRAWSGNVVALGLAAGFLEPLESTSIHLVQSGLARLLAFWPGATIASADRDAFNRQTATEWEAVRDFLILHYHLNRRPEPFWRHCRELPLPDGLQARVDLFRANGRLAREGDELFTEASWLQLLTGQGVRPAGHHALADGLPADELARFLRAGANHAAGVAAGLPDHLAFLARLDPPAEAAA